MLFTAGSPGSCSGSTAHTTGYKYHVGILKHLLNFCAAFLGSMGTSIAGMSHGNDKVTMIGLICSMLSAAIYAAAEAYVDAHRNDGA